jgi:hypothetical protein
LCALRNLEKKIVLCKKGDEITGLTVFFFILALDELYACTFLNKPGSGFVDPIPFISIFTIHAHPGLNLCRIKTFSAPKNERKLHLCIS